MLTCVNNEHRQVFSYCFKNKWRLLVKVRLGASDYSRIGLLSLRALAKTEWTLSETLTGSGLVDTSISLKPLVFSLNEDHPSLCCGRASFLTQQPCSHLFQLRLRQPV